MVTKLCSREQLRNLTPDQEAAIKFTTSDLLRSQPSTTKRCAHVFADITHEEKPSEDKQQAKRMRFGANTEIEDDNEDTGLPFLTLW